MSSLGKLQASFASASQETTIALANANFDFSLIKCEAPAEYKELGLALAKNKRSSAESGPAHITARRLGSLFQTILPDTPRLIRAYGQRASEIAKSPEVNPKGKTEHGIFQDYIGVDGTSIWAAATSGSAAIAAHLLACLIAVMWEPDEATAIWIEIVTERKRQLEEHTANTDVFDVREVVAAKLELDQEQLASWDASARAWLAAARDAPTVSSRHKAALAALGKVNTTVSSSNNLYNSVIEAWKMSLETFEKLIGGTSYSIQDGAVALALVAWHIYPDLVILGPQTTEVRQHDDLVESGGVVTIGLESPFAREAEGSYGVHWSLSLAHLRYYGTGKLTSRSLNSTPSGDNRFTFDEFVLVFIGAAIGMWNAYERVSIEEAMKLLELVVWKFKSTFEDSLPRETGTKMIENSWIGVFWRSLEAYFRGSAEVRNHSSKLLDLGLRQRKFIISRRIPHMGPHYENFYGFGLGTVTFAEVIKDKDEQEKFISENLSATCQRRRSPSHRPGSFSGFWIYWKKYQEPKEMTLYSRTPIERWKKHTKTPNSIQEILPDGGYRISCSQDPICTSPDGEYFGWANPSKPLRTLFRQYATREKIATEEQNADTDDEFVEGFQFVELTRTRTSVVLTPLKGPDDDPVSGAHDFPPSYKNIMKTLQESTLDPMSLLKFMVDRNAMRWFLGIAIMSQLYKDLPGATISPRILQTQNLADALPTHLPQPQNHNVQALFERFQGRGMWTRGRFFRVLMALETGRDADLIVRPGMQEWEQLVALSTEDTLYIDSKIMESPSASTSRKFTLRRVRGNVGRPGLTLIGWFSSPSRLESRASDLDMWHVINHNSFNGKLEDCFSGMSLQLQFTGYRKDLDFGAHNKVPNGQFVEAVVSAYDAGRWLCDIDATSLLRHSLIRVVERLQECPENTPIVSSQPPCDLVSVENWEELLSPHPKSPMAVKCYGNWQARMAALAICSRRAYQTLVFDGHGCWSCAFKTLRKMKKFLRDQEMVGQDKKSYPAPISDESDTDTDESDDSDDSRETDHTGERDKFERNEENPIDEANTQLKSPGGDDTEPVPTATTDVSGASQSEEPEVAAEKGSKSLLSEENGDKSSKEGDDTDSVTSEESELPSEYEEGPYIPVVFIL